MSPEPYATTPLIRDIFRGPGGTRLPPNIPVSPGQSPLPGKPPSEDSCAKTMSSEHSGGQGSTRSHNFNSQPEKGEKGEDAPLISRASLSFCCHFDYCGCK